MALTTRGSATSHRRLLAAFLGCAIVLLGVVPAAQAQSAFFTCRASALELDIANQGGNENALFMPVVANGPRGTNQPCRDDFAQSPREGTTSLNPIPVQLTAEALFARTTSTGSLNDPPSQRSAFSEAGASNVELRVGPDPEGPAEPPLVVQIEAIRSEARASCAAENQPVFTRKFEALNVTVNGTTYPQLGDALIAITNALQPLAPLVDANFGVRIPASGGSATNNTQEGGALANDEATGLRALQLLLLSAVPAPNSPLVDVILAESTVDRHGNVCAAATNVCPPGFVNTAPPGEVPICVSTLTQCPATAPLDPATGQCIRTDAGCPPTAREIGGQCIITDIACPPGTSGPTPVGQCVLPATSGGDVPVGGFLFPLQQVIGALGASPCTAPRFGGEFAILGTLDDDFITGTNGSDRIFSLTGDDRVSGGRGDDCIEGAQGRDNLDGSNGNDFLLGGADRDILSGGSGRDQFDGGAGKDKMTGGSGVDTFSGGANRDKMSGGLGNDKISGGGGGDYIEAGQGRDTVNGGAGNDAINVAESGPGRDTVNCGAGRDTVRSNPRDRVRRCERVLTTRLRGRR